MLALTGVQGFSRDELVVSPGQPQQCCGADEEGARVSQGDCLGSQGRPAGRRGWELKPCWPLTGCILCLLSPHESVLQDSTLSCVWRVYLRNSMSDIQHCLPPLFQFHCSVRGR